MCVIFKTFVNRCPHSALGVIKLVLRYRIMFKCEETKKISIPDKEAYVGPNRVLKHTLLLSIYAQRTEGCLKKSRFFLVVF